jgi:hypothetical protein
MSLTWFTICQFTQIKKNRYIFIKDELYMISGLIIDYFKHKTTKYLIVKSAL